MNRKRQEWIDGLIRWMYGYIMNGRMDQYYTLGEPVSLTR